MAQFDIPDEHMEAAMQQQRLANAAMQVGGVLVIDFPNGPDGMAHTSAWTGCVAKEIREYLGALTRESLDDDRVKA